MAEGSCSSGGDSAVTATAVVHCCEQSVGAGQECTCFCQHPLSQQLLHALEERLARARRLVAQAETCRDFATQTPLPNLGSPCCGLASCQAAGHPPAPPQLRAAVASLAQIQKASQQKALAAKIGTGTQTSTVAGTAWVKLKTENLSTNTRPPAPTPPPVSPGPEPTLPDLTSSQSWRPHACEVCGKRFSRPRNVDHHRRKEH